MTVTARKRDPLTAFRYRVVIEGYAAIGFTDISGIQGESTSIQYREGSDEDRFRKYPGLTTYENIVCKRGLDPSNVLQEIRNAIILPGGPNFGSGVPDPEYRFNGFIYVLEKDRTIGKIMKWINGWGRLYGWDPLSSSTEETLLETLEIVHEGLIPIKG